MAMNQSLRWRHAVPGSLPDTAEKSVPRKQGPCGTLADRRARLANEHVSGSWIASARSGSSTRKKKRSRSALKAQLKQRVPLILLPHWRLIIFVIALHVPRQFHRCGHLQGLGITAAGNKHERVLCHRLLGRRPGVPHEATPKTVALFR